MAFRSPSVTNKATRFVRPHLAKSGIEGFFLAADRRRDLPTKKPDPGPLLPRGRAPLGVPPHRAADGRRIRSTTSSPRAPPAARCWLYRTATTRASRCKTSLPMV